MSLIEILDIFQLIVTPILVAAFSLILLRWIKRENKQKENVTDILESELRFTAQRMHDISEQLDRIRTDSVRISDTIAHLKRDKKKNNIFYGNNEFERDNLREKIKLVKSNGRSFLAIIEAYEEIANETNNKFVDLNEIINRMSKSREVSRNSSVVKFQRLREAFPEFVQIEIDRGGKTFVRISI